MNPRKAIVWLLPLIAALVPGVYLWVIVKRTNQPEPGDLTAPTCLAGFVLIILLMGKTLLFEHPWKNQQ
jgi:hypothetical protein